MTAGGRLRVAVAGRLASSIVRVLYRGVRASVQGPQPLDPEWDRSRPAIFVLWHGRLLPLLHLYRDRGIVILVSQHRDGEYLTRLARGLGYQAIRGSSTRGGFRAARQLARAVDGGKTLAITPDGPRGPREQFKPGALRVARLTGAPVIPISAGTPDAWWTEGWDRFLIPKPCARIRVAAGEPTVIARTATTADLEVAARGLQRQLATLQSLVDHTPKLTRASR